MDTPRHREEIADALPGEAAPLIPYIAAIDDKAITAAVIECLKRAPEYFWRASASGTPQYHAACCLGEGGLVRHTAAACRIYLSIAISIWSEYVYYQHQRECGLAALILRDTHVLGFAGCYNVHSHPILAADQWRAIASTHGVNHAKKIQIAQAIESHMGKWTRSQESATVLPEPSSELEKMVSLADFLASRKHITISTD